MSEPVSRLRVLVKAEGWGGSSWTGRGRAGPGAWVPCSCAQSVPGSAEPGTGRSLPWRKPGAQGLLGDLAHLALPPRCTKATWTTLGTRTTPGSRRWPSVSTSQTRATWN